MIKEGNDQDDIEEVENNNICLLEFEEEEVLMNEDTNKQDKVEETNEQHFGLGDRSPSTNPGAEPPRDARDSGSARSHSTHLETSSSDRP